MPLNVRWALTIVSRVNDKLLQLRPVLENERLSFGMIMIIIDVTRFNLQFSSRSKYIKYIFSNGQTHALSTSSRSFLEGLPHRPFMYHLAWDPNHQVSRIVNEMLDPKENL